VNPGDVRVVSLTEVALRRQQVALDVVTEVRTKEADGVENAFTLDTVNRVLAEADLPPASALSVEVDHTGTAAPAGEAAPERPTSVPSAVDIRLIVVSVGAGFGGLVIVATILMWYRRGGRLLWRNDTRICTCHLHDCDLHTGQLAAVAKGTFNQSSEVQDYLVPMHTQGRAPVQTAAESYPQPENLVHGPVHSCNSEAMADEVESVFVDIPLEMAARHSAPLNSLHGGQAVRASGELSFVGRNVSRPTGKVRGSTQKPGNGGKTPNPFRNPAILATGRQGYFYPPEMPASESTSSQLLGGKSSS